IDRIEVVHGPGSVLYGSDAIGGVINVLTNEDPHFSAEPEVGGRFYSRFASADRETSSRLEGFYSDSDIYAFVGGTYRHFSDLEGGRGIGTQSPGGWRENNVDGQVNFKLDEDSQIEVFVQDYSRSNSTRFDKPTKVREADRTLVGVRYETHDLGQIDDLEVTAYYHNQKSYTHDTFSDSNTQDETIGFDLQATSTPTEDWLITYGFHAHRDKLDANDPKKGTSTPDVEWLNPALYALNEVDVTERLRLDFGVRWDSFNLQSDAPPSDKIDSNIQEAIDSGALTLEDLELDDTDQAFTGGVGATYKLTNETNLVGHIGRSFRAPGRSDQLRFGQFSYGFGVPTTDINPESSITYELGLRHQTDDFAGSITGFYTEIEDAIVTEQGTFNGSDFIDVNSNGIHDSGEQVYVKGNSTGTVRAAGIDTEIRGWVPDSWTRSLIGSAALSYYGNFSYIYGKDSGSGEPLERGYPANALVGIRLDETRSEEDSRWWVEMESWLVNNYDRIPSNRRTSDPAYKNDPQDSGSGLIGGDGSLPSFAVFNVRGGRKINDDITLNVGVENLTDRAYRVKDSRIDAAGINLMVGLEISF
ncbi:MAG: TonB-dependent receptor, partial [Gammaproteobacteria bacterium]|nr:TonB-dependent receptor [Gammaproteobacteria bacterium]